MDGKEKFLFDEQQLIRQLQQGDARAFTVVYNQYSKKLYRHAVKVVKSATLAEDVVHDVFVKLWNNAASLQIDSLQAYLFKTTHNTLLNLIKRSATEERIVDEMIHSALQQSHCTQEALDFKDTLQHTREAINALPPQRKLIFELGRNEGMSHREIARHLNIADSTVNNQMVKAIRTIRKSLLLKGSIGLYFFFLFLFQ